MKRELVYFSQLQTDIEYLIGKNDQDNFNVIDNAKPNDIWFHLNDYPSCHVVALIPNNINKKNMKYITKQGALLCKQNSKYKLEKNLSIVYTQVKNITKTDKIGLVISTNTKIIQI